MKGKKMHISNSKHSKFKIINSNDNKFILRLFNFKNFNKKHHSKNDLKNNNVFVLDLKFNSIKSIYFYSYHYFSDSFFCVLNLF